MFAPETPVIGLSLVIPRLGLPFVAFRPLLIHPISFQSSIYPIHPLHRLMPFIPVIRDWRTLHGFGLSDYGNYGDLGDSGDTPPPSPIRTSKGLTGFLPIDPQMALLQLQAVSSFIPIRSPFCA